MKRSYLLPVIIVVLLYACYFEDIPRSTTTTTNSQLCTGSTLSAQATPQNASGCGKSDGSITISATGGTGPYQYSLDGGVKQSSNIFSNISAGSYSVTVYDVVPCSFTLTNITVGANGSTLAANSSVTPNTGCLTPNGAVQLGATGGSSPYSYSFNSSAFSSTSLYSGLAAGTYKASIKDNTGCALSISVIVSNGTSSVTYTNYLKNIITKDCSYSGCHQPGNRNPPYDLSTYNNCVANAAAIKSKTADGSMPKAPHSGTLSANDIKQIACWVDGGMPQ